MAVFVDIYGNEARELIAAERFGVISASKSQKTKNQKTKSKKRKN